MLQLSLKVFRFFLIGILFVSLFVSGCAGNPGKRSATHLAGVVPLLDTASERRSLDQTQTKILSTAKELLGTPYRFGGVNPRTGFDCSGYVAYVYNKAVGVALPRQAREQIEIGNPVSSKLQPGDMVYFKISEPNAWHTGIYIGQGNFIHAPRTAGAVNIQDMRLPYWKKRFFGARRLL